MSYGQSIYGIGVYESLTPAPITKYTQFYASGPYAIDDLHIVSVTYDDSQIESVYRAGQPQDRNVYTVILAPFDGNTEAGDVDFGGLTIASWNVYRDGELIAEYPNIDAVSLSHTDYSVSARQRYEYAVRPVASNGVEGDATVTFITPQFDGFWIVDPDAPDEALFQFLWNTEPSTNIYEEDRAEIRTFARKAFIRYGEYNAERGEVGGLLDTRENYLRLKDIVRLRRPLLLKTWRGDKWRVNIYDLERIPVAEGEVLSVAWTEVSE